MHSPGGIPGTSSAVTWNATAAERAWNVEPGPLATALGTGVVAGASLSTIGALYRAGILVPAVYQATRPYWWAVYNAYKEMSDIKHFLKGGKFEASWSLTQRPIGLKGFMHRIIPVAIPFPWLDLQGVHVDGSSSHGLVQNGGPSAPKPLVRSGPSSDVLSLGKTLKTQSAHGFRPGKAPARRQRRCPPGHRWDPQLRICVRKWTQEEKRDWNKRFRKRS